jgi:hypothetical protein
MQRHYDLAGQAPADIQMLYYYIILPRKKQGVSAIFSDFFRIRQKPERSRRDF